MNTRNIFDSLITVMTTLKSNNVHEYFYSLGFTVFKETPNALTFIAKSTATFNKVYQIDFYKNEIIGCVHITDATIDFEILKNYALNEYGFLTLTDDGKNTTVLTKERFNCFLIVRPSFDNQLSYKIKIISKQMRN